MHHEGVSHLDLKLDNILLGKDFTLKIADFDACYWLNHHHTHKIARKGTKNFRSPEIKEGKLLCPFPSDIYSAGIILFAMKTGMLPYQEDHNEKMYLAMLNDPTAFWEAQNENNESWVYFDEDFKELFISMIRPNPFRRASIAAPGLRAAGLRHEETPNAASGYLLFEARVAPENHVKVLKSATSPTAKHTLASSLPRARSLSKTCT